MSQSHLAWDTLLKCQRNKLYNLRLFYSYPCVLHAMLMLSLPLIIYRYHWPLLALPLPTYNYHCLLKVTIDYILIVILDRYLALPLTLPMIVVYRRHWLLRSVTIALQLIAVSTDHQTAASAPEHCPGWLVVLLMMIIVHYLNHGTCTAQEIITTARSCEHV